MPTLPNMGLITPAQGGDSGTWDDKINAALGLLDAHDHTAGKGAQIPVAGLDIDADLSIGGFGLTNVGQIDFIEVATLTAGAQILFVDEDDGELYWRTASGTNVKLTDGTSINTTLVGGIVGDYSSVGAEVSYSDADQIYTFKDESSPTKKWARIGSGPVRVFEFDTTESVYVEFAVASALASSYTLTWPAALPSVPALIQVAPGTGIVTFATAPQCIRSFGPDNFREIGGSAHTLAVEWSLGSSVNVLRCPLPFDNDDVITSVSVYVNKASDATNTLRVSVVKYTNAGVVSSSSNTDLSTAAPGASVITVSGLSLTVDPGFYYVIVVQQTDSTPNAVDKIYNAAVTYSKHLTV